MESEELMELLDSLLRADRKNEVLEFKEAKKSFAKDDLGRYFSALSNEANIAGKAYAWLLFGVDNTKQIVGTSISEKLLNEYKLEISNNTSPMLSFLSTYQCNKDGVEVDYEHFSCPFLLAIDKVHSRIRNLKYRYIKDGSLFPDETLRYDPFIIRESLNNCIAHQDYTLGGKINIVEYENSMLVFSNAGDFIPKSVDNVLKNDAPESVYRNPFLAEAMVNLNMIDTIGSGIRKMFILQKNKFFPLPDYDLTNREVKIKIIGKVHDEQYARKLAQLPDLSLSDIVLLDRVQKKLSLTDDAFKYLKSKKLIEGRKNNYTLSSIVAKVTHQEADYMNHVGIDDDYCKKMILDYIKRFGSAKKAQLEDFLLPKLSDNLNEQQKKDKIKNILQALRRKGLISSVGKEWIMSKTDEF